MTEVIFAYQYLEKDRIAQVVFLLTQLTSVFGFELGNIMFLCTFECLWKIAENNLGNDWGSVKGGFALSCLCEDPKIHLCPHSSFAFLSQTIIIEELSFQAAELHCPDTSVTHF